MGVREMRVRVGLAKRAERQRRGARRVLVVLLQRRRSQPWVVLYRVLRGTSVCQLPHLHVIVYYVIGELRLLEAGGRHALLAGGWRVR